MIRAKVTGEVSQAIVASYTIVTPFFSGGPIQEQDAKACVYHVLGVIAAGSFECGTKMPSIYTKVSAYIDWIESHVWPHDC